MLFIGVSTQKSAIRRVFPRWVEVLGLDAAIEGRDIPLGAAPELYQAALAEIAETADIAGALITSHKTALHAACAERFAHLEHDAMRLGEISCVYKRDGRLLGDALDPLTAGRAMAEFLPQEHFAQTRAEALCLGAGGAGLAIVDHLLRRAQPPARIHLTDISSGRIELLQHHLRALDPHGLVCLHCTCGTVDVGALVEDLQPGSLVVNATGLGKDRPGSPMDDATLLPEGGVVWELNYRGDRPFYRQALRQAVPRGLRVADGWSYFLHGWMAHIRRVLDVDLPVSGPGFNELGRIARAASS